MGAATMGEADMARLPDLASPLEVEVDESEGRIELCDRDERFAYELRFRDGTGRYAGPGWVELTELSRGARQLVAVRTAEVMAVLSDVGREEDAAAMTRALALWFELPHCPEADKVAARLRAEVAAGYGRERVSVRRLKAAITERLVEGETLVTLCERGGFKTARGRADTSWLQRRAGLSPTRCSRTGKLRTARTASYEVFCRLVRAIEREPWEFGV